ncbi:MAG: hypothetical protein P4M01_02410 [Acidobacteriota bacterium]|nr:hypothetical protein [Acidobacteriota bacterium]
MLQNRILRTALLVALAACTLVALPSTAAAQRVFVGGHRGFWGGGPYWGSYWGPYGWDYPGPYGAYGYPGRPLGEVQIKSPTPDAQIFINGSLAGRAKDLKHFWLQPGTYTLEQHAGTDVQKLRIYVIADRTVKITFDKPGVPHNPPAPAAEPAPAPVPPPPAPVPAPAQSTPAPSAAPAAAPAAQATATPAA